MPVLVAPSVQALPISTFATLHLDHILAHPPDHILFPFLHGLEGDNAAQNTFFSGSNVRVPAYRGLIWVVCEDDLVKHERKFAGSLRVLRRRGPYTGDLEDPVSECESVSDSASSDFEDDDEEDEEHMHVQGVVYPEPKVIPMDIDTDVDTERDGEGAIRFVVEPTMKDERERHMHPVVQRPGPIQIQTINLAHRDADSAGTTTSMNTPSICASSTSSASTSTSTDGFFTLPPPPSTSPPSTAPCSPFIPPPSPPPSPQTTAIPTTSPDTDLVLLTSSFRPSEIIRRRLSANPNDNTSTKDTGWEFVPARVPEGISLRNFGIQVPIYATISDIVVYSPLGASANAISLAERLKEAISRKYEDRKTARGWTKAKSRSRSRDDGEPPHPYDGEEVGAGEGDPENLLKYNVYVLDADVDEMRKVVPHLVMRVCEGGVPGGTSSSGPSSSSCAASAGGGGAHTDGPDGHLVDMNMDVDSSAPPATTATYSEPNTVDFAQREKEEMRDLTKASEIISLFPALPPLASPSPPTSSSTPMDSPLPLEQGRDSLPPLDLSTTRSHFDPQVGQIFLGNADDVPLTPRLVSIPPPPRKSNVTQETIPAEEVPPEDDPFNYCPANDPARGLGYDICVECHDLAPFPTSAHLRKAEEHLNVLDVWWAERWLAAKRKKEGGDVHDHDALIDLPPRPPPNSSAVIHLPFPSSPTNTQMSMGALMPVIRFLERWVRPVVRVSSPPVPGPPPPQTRSATTETPTVPSNASPRRWSAVASIMPHFSSFTSSPAQPQSQSQLPDSNSDPDPNAINNNASTSAPTPPPTSRTRSFTSPSLHPTQQQPPISISPLAARTRPLKILIYSSDGYTESSVPALCLLMAIKSLSLPEAYLELQVAKRRSFFVYQGDLGLLRRVEGRVREEREREKEREVVNGNGKRVLGVVGGQGRQGWDQMAHTSAGQVHAPPYAAYGRRPAKSVSFSQGPPVVVVSQQPAPKSPPIVVPSQSLNLEGCDVGSCSAPQIQGPGSSSQMTVKGRPRASTSPWLPSSFGGDHQSWFNDPRFDGSFPSRVLPFLYLGNLNHASNAYMLHALGITHVVSVGECALVPPPHHVHGHGHHGLGHTSSTPFHNTPGPNARYVPGKGPGGHGSLWFEEREGRIKVLDIKGVCDDGIDTLEPQLEPICEWIDKARMEGGQVLVHCRVGVSRSATVTIAYVMKHLGLPLVDAYLIVRSRRLSVLIQPNMRLLYNLCGWEIKLAKGRAGEDEGRMRKELARTLIWPYLAKEVHALNEKYLH